MTGASTFSRLLGAGVFLAAVVACGWWLLSREPGTQAPDKPPPPTEIAKIVKEDEFNTITLSAEGAQRIGLALAKIEKKDVRRWRVYGGEVMIPAGRTILVSAPVAGVLEAPSEGERSVGQEVQAGTIVLLLTPLLTPDARATLSATLNEAEGQVNNAKTQVKLTKIAFERAKKVLQEGAGSQRQVDEAEAAYQLAVKTQEAASARQATLEKALGDAESGTTAPIPIAAPQKGLIRAFSAAPGQIVPNGAALFELIDGADVWIRVALPVGDLETVDRVSPARIGKLAAAPGEHTAPAEPVPAPPSANPLAATVDAYYSLSNASGKLIPGQRVGVSIPLADEETGLTAPWSAVVFDIHGGTWVYEKVGERRFTRRRVIVGYTHESDAVLLEGPDEGSEVVSAGAQELFGAETGFVK